MPLSRVLPIRFSAVFWLLVCLLQFPTTLFDFTSSSSSSSSSPPPFFVQAAASSSSETLILQPSPLVKYVTINEATFGSQYSSVLLQGYDVRILRFESIDAPTLLSKLTGTTAQFANVTVSDCKIGLIEFVSVPDMVTTFISIQRSRIGFINSMSTKLLSGSTLQIQDCIFRKDTAYVDFGLEAALANKTFPDCAIYTPTQWTISSFSTFRFQRNDIENLEFHTTYLTVKKNSVYEFLGNKFTITKQLTQGVNVIVAPSFVALTDDSKIVFADNELDVELTRSVAKIYIGKKFGAGCAVIGTNNVVKAKLFPHADPSWSGFEGLTFDVAMHDNTSSSSPTPDGLDQTPKTGSNISVRNNSVQIVNDIEFDGDFYTGLAIMTSGHAGEFVEMIDNNVTIAFPAGVRPARDRVSWVKHQSQRERTALACKLTLAYVSNWKLLRVSGNFVFLDGFLHGIGVYVETTHVSHVDEIILHNNTCLFGLVEDCVGVSLEFTDRHIAHLKHIDYISYRGNTVETLEHVYDADYGWSLSPDWTTGLRINNREINVVNNQKHPCPLIEYGRLIEFVNNTVRLVAGAQCFGIEPAISASKYLDHLVVAHNDVVVLPRRLPGPDKKQKVAGIRLIPDMSFGKTLKFYENTIYVGPNQLDIQDFISGMNFWSKRNVTEAAEITVGPNNRITVENGRVVSPAETVSGIAFSASMFWLHAKRFAVIDNFINVSTIAGLKHCLCGISFIAGNYIGGAVLEFLRNNITSRGVASAVGIGLIAANIDSTKIVGPTTGPGGLHISITFAKAATVRVGQIRVEGNLLDVTTVGDGFTGVFSLTGGNWEGWSPTRMDALTEAPSDFDDDDNRNNNNNHAATKTTTALPPFEYLDIYTGRIRHIYQAGFNLSIFNNRIIAGNYRSDTQPAAGRVLPLFSILRTNETNHFERSGFPVTAHTFSPHYGSRIGLIDMQNNSITIFVVQRQRPFSLEGLRFALIGVESPIAIDYGIVSRNTSMLFIPFPTNIFRNGNPDSVPLFRKHNSLYLTTLSVDRPHLGATFQGFDMNSWQSRVTSALEKDIVVKGGGGGYPQLGPKLFRGCEILDQETTSRHLLNDGFDYLSSVVDQEEVAMTTDTTTTQQEHFGFLFPSLNFEAVAAPVQWVVCGEKPLPRTESESVSDSETVESESGSFSIPQTLSRTVSPGEGIPTYQRLGLDEQQAEELSTSTATVLSISSAASADPGSVLTAVRGLGVLNVLSCAMEARMHGAGTPAAAGNSNGGRSKARYESYLNRTKAAVHELLNDPLPFPVSITPGLAVGGNPGRYARGAVVANLTIFALVALLAYQVGVFFKGKFDDVAKTCTDSRRYLSEAPAFRHAPIPFLIFFVFAFVCSGWAQAAVILVHVSEGALGIIPLVLLTLIAFWFVYDLWKEVLCSRRARRPTLYPCLLYFWCEEPPSDTVEKVRAFLKTDTARWMYYGTKRWDYWNGLLSYLTVSTKEMPPLPPSAFAMHRTLLSNNVGPTAGQAFLLSGDGIDNNDEDDSGDEEKERDDGREKEDDNNNNSNGRRSKAKGKGKSKDAKGNDSSNKKKKKKNNKKKTTEKTEFDAEIDAEFASFDRFNNRNNQTQEQEQQARGGGGRGSTGRRGLGPRDQDYYDYYSGDENNNTNGNSNSSNNNNKDHKDKNLPLLIRTRIAVAPFATYIDILLTTIIAICNAVANVKPEACTTLLPVSLVLVGCHSFLGLVLRTEIVPRRRIAAAMTLFLILVQCLLSGIAIEVATAAAASENVGSGGDPPAAAENLLIACQYIATIGQMVVSLPSLALNGSFFVLCVVAKCRIVSRPGLKRLLQAESESANSVLLMPILTQRASLLFDDDDDDDDANTNTMHYSRRNQNLLQFLQGSKSVPNTTSTGGNGSNNNDHGSTSSNKNPNRSPRNHETTSSPRERSGAHRQTNPTHRPRSSTHARASTTPVAGPAHHHDHYDDDDYEDEDKKLSYLLGEPIQTGRATPTRSRHHHSHQQHDHQYHSHHPQQQQHERHRHRGDDRGDPHYPSSSESRSRRRNGPLHDTSNSDPHFHSRSWRQRNDYDYQYHDRGYNSPHVYQQQQQHQQPRYRGQQQNDHPPPPHRNYPPPHVDQRYPTTNHGPYQFEL